MKLGTIKRISKEDISKKGTPPDWIDALLDPLNEFIEKTGQALGGNLTFEDNFLSKTVDQEFTDGVELILNPFLAGRTGLRPYGVIPVSTTGLELNSITWRNLDTGNIGVTLGFGTPATTKCKLLILLR